MEKIEIVSELKRLTAELNEIIDKASEIRLKVIAVQRFHPMSNSITNPFNPPISLSITETTEY